MQKDNLILKGFSEASNEPMTVISDDDAPVKIVLLVFNSVRNELSQYQMANHLDKSYFQI